ncbi:PadR family transcriptional regulator [Lysinibacillus sp. NPDC097279]|uniref:PadR family transcriptional regulator n=1 Tax=Lysinibacillus sp. NPDC097279 TaxID=3364143 RepID=UPI0037F3910C
MLGHYNAMFRTLIKNDMYQLYICMIDTYVLEKYNYLMNNKNNNTQYLKGLFEIAILMMLQKKKMYGYELTKELKESKCFSISDGSIYPILKRLTANDYVDVFSEEYEGRIRKYYRITDLGKALVENRLKELESILKYFEEIKGMD